MSHKATVKTQIKDVNALRAALADMGLVLGPAGDVRWYQGTMPADHVVKLPGTYDIGFKNEADGSLSFVCDTECMGGSYSRGADAREILGPNGSKLLDKYLEKYLPVWASGQGMVSKVESTDEGEVYEINLYE